MYVKFSAFCDLLQKQIRKTRNQCANIVLIRSRFIYSPFALNHIHTHSFYFWHCYYCTWLFFFFLIPLEPCAFYFARDLLLCDSEWRFALESDTIDGTVSFCSSTRYQEKFKLCISSNSKFSYDICILWWKKIVWNHLIWFLYILIPGKKHYTYFYTEMCVCYYSTKENIIQRKEKTTTVYYPDYRQNDQLICFYFQTFGRLRCVQTVKWDWEFIHGCFFPRVFSMCAVNQRLFKIRSNDEFELSSMNKSIQIFSHRYHVCGKNKIIR